MTDKKINKGEKMEVNNNVKENNLIHFKAKIEFDNKKFFVVDNFKFENEKYFYIIEDKSKEIEECGSIDNFKGKIRMEYIFQIEPGIYKTVSDIELIKKLDLIQVQRLLNN